MADSATRAGLVLTVPSLELGADTILAPLAAPPDRGGVLGLLEPLLASTGRGVCAETLMPDGALAATLGSAREAAARLLPAGLNPGGWWPLLDAPLVPHRSAPVGVRRGRPVVRFSSHRAAAALWRARLSRFGEEWRPFERQRPGRLDARIPEAVGGAGFDYMWSKVGFGRPRVVHRDGDFVALSLTAGSWDGWSPFYTVGSTGDVARAERRLRGGPGWLVGTIDAPLWALSGEVLERGPDLLRIAELVAGGGRSGRLVNVTPNVVARYARLLDELGLLAR